MKKQMLMTLLLLSALLAQGQVYNSQVYRYSTPTGTEEMTRVDPTHTYTVTYCRPTAGDMTFMVESGGISRYFTTVLPPGMQQITPHGYCVKDMEMSGTDCYFCGYYWWETGNIIYFLDGTWTMEHAYRGFVGRFSAVDVMAGAGNCGICLIEGTVDLSHLAVHQNMVTAIGVSDSADRSCVVEMTMGTSLYSYHVLFSPVNGEVFTDIAPLYDEWEVATVSRFDATATELLHARYFGLRYGAVGNYYGTADNLYLYDVDGLATGEVGFLRNVDTMQMCAIHDREGLVLGHLATPGSELGDHLILYRILNEGAPIDRVQFMHGLVRYTRLVDMRFNRPLATKSWLAVQLWEEDKISNIRFPHCEKTASYTDTMLTTSSIRIGSGDPYQTTAGMMSLKVGGYYYNVNSDLAAFQLHQIHHNGFDWSQYSCFQPIEADIEALQVDRSPEIEEYPMRLYYEMSEAFIVYHAFESPQAYSALKCKNAIDIQ